MQDEDKKPETMSSTENSETNAGTDDVSQVIRKRRVSGYWGLLATLGVLGLILGVMWGTEDAPHQVPLPEAIQTEDTLVFQQNAHRLSEEFKRSNAPIMGSAENEEMKARRNAPTVMVVNTSITDKPAATSDTPLFSDHSVFGDYANHQATVPSRVSAEKISHPETTVPEGEFIHANLETAINSDLPGKVRAVITEPVYSLTADHALIPKGSRLIGEYASESSNGLSSSRVFVMWDRIITPAGISIMINSPGADNLGRSGASADHIDTHFWKMFGSAALLSILGYEASSGGVSSYDQPNSADQYRAGIANSFNQSAQTVLQNNLNIKPTLHVHQGDAVIVFVAHDIDLSVLGESS